MRVTFMALDAVRQILRPFTACAVAMSIVHRVAALVVCPQPDAGDDTLPFPCYSLLEQQGIALLELRLCFENIEAPASVVRSLPPVACIGHRICRRSVVNSEHVWWPEEGEGGGVLEQVPSVSFVDGVGL
eukprot:SAG31_NODE_2421_length_5725_cov_14.985605_4_plen_130_part_00